MSHWRNARGRQGRKGNPYVTGVYRKCNVLDLHATAYRWHHAHNLSSLIDSFCYHKNVSMIVSSCIACFGCHCWNTKETNISNKMLMFLSIFLLPLAVILDLYCVLTSHNRTSAVKLQRNVIRSHSQAFASQPWSIYLGSHYRSDISYHDSLSPASNGTLHTCGVPSSPHFFLFQNPLHLDVLNMKEKICRYFHFIMPLKIFSKVCFIYICTNILKWEKNTWSLSWTGVPHWTGINELGEREKWRERRGEAVMFDVGMWFPYWVTYLGSERNPWQKAFPGFCRESE